MSIALAGPSALYDPALPTSALALDREFAQEAIARATARGAGDLTVVDLRVARHERGRRLVVEYDLEHTDAAGAQEWLTAVADIRRRRSGRSQLGLVRALRAAGFDDTSRDGVSVPEPLGLVPELRAWLQRKVTGMPVGDVADESYGTALMSRVAGAVHKLHAAGVTPRRIHTIADQLALVRDRGAALAARRPALARRLVRVLAACDRAGAALPEATPCGVHRDLCGEHVLVDGGRLWLAELGLFCAGDPALDAGCFLGHLGAQALRDHGDPAALAAQEAAFEETFLAAAGRHRRHAVHTYAVLTLVREVERSSDLRGREGLTEALLEVCEDRLDVAPRRTF